MDRTFGAIGHGRHSLMLVHRMAEKRLHLLFLRQHAVRVVNQWRHTPYIIGRLRVVILDMLLAINNKVTHHLMNHAPDYFINKDFPVTF